MHRGSLRGIGDSDFVHVGGGEWERGGDPKAIPRRVPIKDHGFGLIWAPFEICFDDLGKTFRTLLGIPGPPGGIPMQS